MEKLVMYTLCKEGVGEVSGKTHISAFFPVDSNFIVTIVTVVCRARLPRLKGVTIPLKQGNSSSRLAASCMAVRDTSFSKSKVFNILGMVIFRHPLVCKAWRHRDDEFWSSSRRYQHGI